MTADHPRPVPDRATGIDLETEAWTLSGQWDRRSNDDPAGCTERMLACASGLAAVIDGRHFRQTGWRPTQWS